jgi:GNAT superfamily N-acetyltransferase
LSKNPRTHDARKPERQLRYSRITKSYGNIALLRFSGPEIVDNHNVAITGQAEWYPVAFFLRDESGEIPGGLLGDIWAAWLHVRTLAVAAPVRGHGFGREMMKRAELYAVERGCTDASLRTSLCHAVFSTTPAALSLFF